MSQSFTTLAIGEITVRQHDGLFYLNDLHRAAGSEDKHQPAFFMRREETQALAAEICSADSQIKAFETVRGRGKAQGTYACRELVIAYAAWISAAFHLKVIRVFLDAVQPVAKAAPKPTPRMDTQWLQDALAASNAVADRVQAVVFARLLDHADDWGNERWLLVFTEGSDGQPQPCVKLVPNDAMIANVVQMAGAIVYGHVKPAPSELLSMVSACSSVLALQAGSQSVTTPPTQQRLLA